MTVGCIKMEMIFINSILIVIYLFSSMIELWYTPKKTIMKQNYHNHNNYHNNNHNNNS